MATESPAHLRHRPFVHAQRSGGAPLLQRPQFPSRPSLEVQSAAMSWAVLPSASTSPFVGRHHLRLERAGDRDLRSSRRAPPSPVRPDSRPRSPACGTGSSRTSNRHDDMNERGEGTSAVEGHQLPWGRTGPPRNAASPTRPGEEPAEPKRGLRNGALNSGARHRITAAHASSGLKKPC